MPREELMEEALTKWGESSQLDMVIEEMAELTQAILKYRREKNVGEYHFRIGNIIDEHADVKIMLDQLGYMMEKHDKNYYHKLREKTVEKVVRLSKRLG